MLTEWYLDLETDGPDPQRNKILTIQYQRLSGGEPDGPFQVLAEWEWGEKQIVLSIVDKGLLEPTDDFLPVGTGIRSHIGFVIAKAEAYGTKEFSPDELRTYWLRKPMIDLASVSVSTLPQGGPVAQGEKVLTLHREGRYKDLVELLTREKDEALVFLRASTHSLGPPSPPHRTVVR